MTTLLKEDGSLDVERIRQLPLEEKKRELSRFTREQMNEYVSKIPINESHEPVKVVEVDYKMEDLLARGYKTAEQISNIIRKHEKRNDT